MSFSCPICGFQNSEIQSAGQLQQKGAKYELRLTTMADFARQVVKSDTCIVKFIELDIEIPAGRGQLTNVEGLLTHMIEDLALQQPARKEQIPEVYVKIENIIAEGKQMIAGDKFPFRLTVDDPSGNSWIEPNEKDGVGKCSRSEYARTIEQNEALGLSHNDQTRSDLASTEHPKQPNPESDDIVPNEVYTFPATCPGCMHNCITHMKMVDIPHFKQVVLMSTVCDTCGYRSNEVKTGGEVPEKGKKTTLKVESPTDLARDILKSESCYMKCPELLLSVNPGTLGGRFTTVEGLLTQVRDDLRSSIFDVDDTMGGDSIPFEVKKNWDIFFEGINKAIVGEKSFTLTLTDPLACSYVQNLCLPEKDPQIVEEDYVRSDEEEDELGLKDMKVEGYEEHEQEENVRGGDTAEAEHKGVEKEEVQP